MKVVSLFDGMGCGYQALKELNIPVSEYHAFEIDKHAIQVSKKNHPNTIHHGSVVGFDFRSLGEIDLLIGGSPCQGFSAAGKRLAFDDPRSKLFFEFTRAKEELNPKWFLLENVKMKQEWQDIISQYMGVQPVMIDSALVSAQRRKRLYWCNWTAGQPDDRGVLLKDIVQERVEHEYAMSEGWCNWWKEKADFQLKKQYSQIDGEKSITQIARQYASWNGQYTYEWLSQYIVPFDKTIKIINAEIEKGKIGYFGTDSQSRRFYHIHDKSVTLCGDAGGGAAKMGQYLFGCITPDRVIKRQNGQRFSDGQKFYTLTAQDKHGILVEGYIRKLTPIECERLQTLPDGYTAGVSDGQRYKMLGNGWTVEVIKHILNSNVFL